MLYFLLIVFRQALNRLPPILQKQLRSQVFRCNGCDKLYPHEFKASQAFSRVATEHIAARVVARQGVSMDVLLSRTQCQKCSLTKYIYAARRMTASNGFRTR